MHIIHIQREKALQKNYSSSKTITLLQILFLPSFVVYIGHLGPGN